MSEHLTSLPPHDPALRPDPIVVIGGGPRALDLLRLATIRSDDIVLVGTGLDAAIRTYAERFAIEPHDREATAADFAGAAAVLVSIGDVAAENRAIRAARRSGIPVFVSDRALVSDFTLIEFLEHRTEPPLAA